MFILALFIGLVVGTIGGFFIGYTAGQIRTLKSLDSRLGAFVRLRGQKPELGSQN